MADTDREQEIVPPAAESASQADANASPISSGLYWVIVAVAVGAVLAWLLWRRQQAQRANERLLQELAADLGAPTAAAGVAAAGPKAADAKVLVTA